MEHTENKIAADKLRNALDEAKRMNELMIGREIKMTEMKARIQELEDKLLH